MQADEINLFFCDVETTGVDPKVNGITQIAAEFGKLGNDGIYHPGPMFDFRMKPFVGDKIEPTALEVQKRTLDEVMAHPAPRLVYEELVANLSMHVDKFDPQQKFFFIGYNSPFDNQFMREWWAKCGDAKYFGSWFFSPDICVMRMAMDKFRFSRHLMKNFKLATVAQRMGIKYDENALHNAATDIAITRDMYLTLTRLDNAHR